MTSTGTASNSATAQEALSRAKTLGLTIAVAGTAEFRLGFELAGVKRFYSLGDKTPEDVFAALQKASSEEGVGIIIVQEEMLTGIPVADRFLLENSVRPVIVTLRKEPGESGLLRRQIIRAIGIDLLAPNSRVHGGA